MENQKIIQVEEKVPFKMLLPLSIQHMFAMFGASVLVPFVFGINPAVVLFMNGIGTLLFILITKGKAPAYLGSSFAFLAPAGVVISKWGYEYALGDGVLSVLVMSASRVIAWYTGVGGIAVVPFDFGCGAMHRSLSNCKNKGVTLAHRPRPCQPIPPSPDVLKLKGACIPPPDVWRWPLVPNQLARFAFAVDVLAELHGFPFGTHTTLICGAIFCASTDANLQASTLLNSCIATALVFNDTLPSLGFEVLTSQEMISTQLMASLPAQLFQRCGQLLSPTP
jgi:hypothetical protein